MENQKENLAEKRIAALQMYVDGFTFGEIALKLDVDNDTIKKWYKEDNWEDIKEETERTIKNKMMEVYEKAQNNKLQLIEKLVNLETLVFDDLILLGLGLDKIIKETNADLRSVQLKDIKKYSMLQETMSKLLGTLSDLRSKYIVEEEDEEEIEEIEVILKAGGVAETVKKPKSDGGENG